MTDDEVTPPGNTGQARGPRWRTIERDRRREQLHELLRERIAGALQILNSSTSLATEYTEYLVRQNLNEMRALLDYPRPPADTGQARESVTLVDLRARIAAAFAAVDNSAGEPPTREQLDWAHIAACVALNIGQDEPPRATVQAPDVAARCSCTATSCLVSCVICGRVSYDGCPNESPRPRPDTTPETDRG